MVLILTGFGAAFAAALSISLVIWTYRDALNVPGILIRILATLVAAILFLPGVLIYIILRPPLTLEDEYQKTLEEALLQSIEDNPLCPGCSRKLDPQWIVCPNCHTRLKKPCTQCGKMMDLAWNLCPYCATPAPGSRLDNAPIDLPPVEETIKDFSVGDDYSFDEK